jgi:hypothetical protein
MPIFEIKGLIRYYAAWQGVITAEFEKRKVAEQQKNT